MLPGPLLLFERRGEDLSPGYLGRGDEPWLRELIDLFDRYVGRPRHQLDAALAEAEPAGWTRRRFRVAACVLERLHGTVIAAAVPPRAARIELFGAAAGTDGARDDLITQVAARLDVKPDELLSSLFADLPGERRLVELEETITPTELALRCNLANVQGLLFRATDVRIAMLGNSRRVVSHARMKGLICAVARRELTTAGSATVIRMSGPYSLFRRTLLYGRALSSLVPQLMWCRRFHLRARCVLPVGEGTLTLEDGAPVLPAKEPRRFDSKLEERFARDFARAAPAWDLVRELEDRQDKLPFASPAFCWIVLSPIGIHCRSLDVSLVRGRSRARVRTRSRRGSPHDGATTPAEALGGRAAGQPAFLAVPGRSSALPA